MTQYKVTLQPSDIMEKNKRETESNFIRMRHSLRKKLGLECDSKVALLKKGSLPQIVLTVRQAYREDILKYSDDNVCFITARNHKFYGSPNEVAISPYDIIDFITMGADPEFILVDPKTKYLHHANHYKCEGFGLESLFGCDGAGGPAEIRPEPAADVKELCKNIAAAFKYGEQFPSVKKLKWLAGAYYEGLPLGGHIHIGYAPQIGLTIRNAEGIRTLVQILDHYLGTLLINVDGTDAEFRKTRGDYGHAGNFRTDHNRFEWRVPSGMWLSDPKYAESILGLAKLLATKYYKEVQKLENITDTNMQKIRTDLFNVSAADMKNNREIIDKHKPLSKKDLGERLNKLSDLLSDAYFIGLFDGVLKTPPPDLHKKETEDLRAIWGI